MESNKKVIQEVVNRFLELTGSIDEVYEYLKKEEKYYREPLANRQPVA